MESDTVGKDLKSAGEFDYLGSKITINEKMQEEIGQRLQKNGNFYNLVKDIIWNIEKGAKTIMYQPILIHGPKTRMKKDLSEIFLEEQK